MDMTNDDREKETEIESPCHKVISRIDLLGGIYIQCLYVNITNIKKNELNMFIVDLCTYTYC